MKTITFTLEPASIERAIREVRAYADEVKAKTERLREMVAERIGWSASQGFSSALAGDVIGVLKNGKLYHAEQPQSDVHVEVDHTQGTVSIIFARGKEAVFIEYGAGVYNNGAAGDSPHPWGARYGYFIGGYGEGYGSKKAWGYPDGAGGIVLTHGTPAAMPMFRGLQEAKNVLDDLMQEVFG